MPRMSYNDFISNYKENNNGSGKGLRKAWKDYKFDNPTDEEILNENNPFTRRLYDGENINDLLQEAYNLSQRKIMRSMGNPEIRMLANDFFNKFSNRAQAIEGGEVLSLSSKISKTLNKYPKIKKTLNILMNAGIITTSVGVQWFLKQQSDNIPLLKLALDSIPRDTRLVLSGLVGVIPKKTTVKEARRFQTENARRMNFRMRRGFSNINILSDFIHDFITNKKTTLIASLVLPRLLENYLKVAKVPTKRLSKFISEIQQGKTDEEITKTIENFMRNIKGNLTELEIKAIATELNLQKHLPLYNYVGPGTALGTKIKSLSNMKENIPRNNLDWAAFRHDLLYNGHDETHKKADKILLDDATKIFKKTKDKDALSVMVAMKAKIAAEKYVSLGEPLSGSKDGKTLPGHFEKVDEIREHYKKALGHLGITYSDNNDVWSQDESLINEEEASKYFNMVEEKYKNLKNIDTNPDNIENPSGMEEITDTGEIVLENAPQQYSSANIDNNFSSFNITETNMPLSNKYTDFLNEYKKINGNGKGVRKAWNAHKNSKVSPPSNIISTGKGGKMPNIPEPIDAKKRTGGTISSAPSPAPAPAPAPEKEKITIRDSAKGGASFTVKPVNINEIDTTPAQKTSMDEEDGQNIEGTFDSELQNPGAKELVDELVPSPEEKEKIIVNSVLFDFVPKQLWKSDANTFNFDVENRKNLMKENPIPSATLPVQFRTNQRVRRPKPSAKTREELTGKFFNVKRNNRTFMTTDPKLNYKLNLIRGAGGIQSNSQFTRSNLYNDCPRSGNDLRVPILTRQ